MGGQGTVYVVSSNFDLRFNRGWLASVDVASLKLPATAGSTPVHDDNPHIQSAVLVDSFGGPVLNMQLASQTGAQRRLFVAARASNVLQAIDVDGATLSCPTSPGGTDCFDHAVNLVQGDNSQLRDAYRPVLAGGQVWVSHLSVVDVPRGSGLLRHSSLARVDPVALGGSPVGFVTIGIEPADGMAEVNGALYLGGRASGTDANSEVLRRLDASGTDPTIVDLPLRSGANVYETRGMATSSDGTRLYLATRTPDALVTLDMSPGLNGRPKETVLGVALLPMPHAAPWLERGALTRLLPGWYADNGPLALYYPNRKLLPSKTRVFIDFIAEAFQSRGLAQRFDGR